MEQEASEKQKGLRDARLGFEEYQKKAFGTLNPKVEMMGKFAMLQNAALGLTGEAGEFADMVKKVIYHDHPFDEPTKGKISKEIGDVIWYCALACTTLGLDMRTVAKENIEKLHARYTDGKFTPDQSLNREDGNPSDMDYGRLQKITKPHLVIEIPEPDPGKVFAGRITNNIPKGEASDAVYNNPDPFKPGTDPAAAAAKA